MDPLPRPSRAAALEALEAFLPLAPDYARRRNEVRPGHPAVSRLSGCLRHRLVTEREVTTAAIQRHGFAAVEKFVQEVAWRLYWKGWLELRPSAWHGYLADLEAMDPEERERTLSASQGGSGIALMDQFARELEETGYLHNHARMWFAGWWTHHAGLPWQAGAAYFLRHLRDGDPAANTLSWRWVAGLHTPGKAYPARPDNVRKHLAPEWLQAHGQSLDSLRGDASLRPHAPGDRLGPEFPRVEFPSRPVLSRVEWDGSTGLWLHEEDLGMETGPLSGARPAALAVAGAEREWAGLDYAPGHQAHLRAALDDGAARAAAACSLPAARPEPGESAADFLVRWASGAGLRRVVTPWAFVGPAAAERQRAAARLAEAGIALVECLREEDAALLPEAGSGFFRFWKTASLSLQRWASSA